MTKVLTEQRKAELRAILRENVESEVESLFADFTDHIDPDTLEELSDADIEYMTNKLSVAIAITEKN